MLDLPDLQATLVQSQHGGANPGTWVHERVAVDLARWFSPNFAVWMDDRILGAIGTSSAASRTLPELESSQPHAISNDPHEERILASKMPINQVPGFVLELHKTRQAELDLENLSHSASRKRTREEAEDDLAVAEIDAKRDLTIAELRVKKDRLVLDLERERLMLQLAKDGHPEALAHLFATRS